MSLMFYLHYLVIAGYLRYMDTCELFKIHPLGTKPCLRLFFMVFSEIGIFPENSYFIQKRGGCQEAWPISPGLILII